MPLVVTPKSGPDSSPVAESGICAVPFSSVVTVTLAPA